MAFDFSQISDGELESVMQSMMDMPSVHDLEIRKATVAEYNRRMAARKAPKTDTPPNVQSKLEAAAAPITTEPVAGPAKPKPVPADPDVRTLASMTDAEMLAPVTEDSFRPTKAGRAAYGERYREAVANTIDAGVDRRQAARSMGYEDPEQLAYNAATGIRPEDYVAAGRPMPLALRPSPEAVLPVSEDDPDYWEKRYQQEVAGTPQSEPTDSVGRVDAYFADKAKRSESGHLLPQYQQPTFDEFVAEQSQQQVRARANRNIATYGTSPSAATPGQSANRALREANENQTRGTRLNNIISRLASQTRTPRPEILARLDSLKGSKDITLNDGLSPQEVALLGQPFIDAARDRKDAKLGDRRDFLERRGMMAGGNPRANAANNFTDMPEDWQNFVRAGGKGATPLDVDAQGAQNAMRFINAEALAGMDPVKREAFLATAGLQMAKGEEELAPEVAAARERERNGGTLPATSSAGQRMLQQLEATVIGPWATQAEVDDAVRRAVASGIPQADAEAHFARRRSLSNWLAGGATAPAPTAAGPK
jgi:hypothetical protein